MDYSNKFLQAVEFVFDREGRTVENISGDSGGVTKFGISHKSYPTLDIANLTEDQAKDIYFRDYWTPLYCEQYESRLALAIFDTGVNNGVGTAKALLAKFGTQAFTVEQFLFKRLRRYISIVQANPSQGKFLLDWVLRVQKVQEFTFI